MKKILLLMMVVVFSSCGTMKYYEASYNINLKEYTGADFTINPSSHASGDFEALGLVEDKFYFGTSVSKKYKDFVVKDKYSYVYQPKLDRIFDNFVKNAKSIGANGIVDFKFEEIRNRDLQTIGYKVSGVAVRYK